MLVYLDNWAVIPLAATWLTNLAILRVHTGPGPAQVQAEHCPRVVSVHSVQVTPGPVKVSPDPDEDVVSIPVILNSVMAIFFPCCHLHPRQGEGQLAEVRVERLRSRQVSCYQLHTI